MNLDSNLDSALLLFWFTLSVCLWENYPTSLCISSLISKMEEVSVSTSWVFLRIMGDDTTGWVLGAVGAPWWQVLTLSLTAVGTSWALLSSSGRWQAGWHDYLRPLPTLRPVIWASLCGVSHLMWFPSVFLKHFYFPMKRENNNMKWKERRKEEL